MKKLERGGHVAQVSNTAFKGLLDIVDAFKKQCNVELTTEMMLVEEDGSKTRIGFEPRKVVPAADSTVAPTPVPTVTPSQAPKTLIDVQIWTNGACSGNPGPGGYAAIIIGGGKEKIVSGGRPQATKSIMELLAICDGLMAIKKPCNITVLSDSKYAIEGVNNWLPGWKKNSWKLKNGNQVANLKMWQWLDRKIENMRKEGYKLSFKHVAGHAGFSYNEKADSIAKAEVIKQKSAQ